MAIREAKGSEILILEELAQRCFDKFSFKEKGVSYCKSSFILRLKEFINSSLFKCLVYVEEDEILGATILSVMPSLYNLSKVSVSELFMQADPSLPKFSQGRIMISFIKYIEEFSRRSGASEVNLSSSSVFDLSNYFNRNGYVLMNKMYMKGVV